MRSVAYQRPVRLDSAPDSAVFVGSGGTLALSGASPGHCFQEPNMPQLFRTGLAVIGLLVLAASLSACIVEEPGRPGHGWCYWHPGACH